MARLRVAATFVPVVALTAETIVRRASSTPVAPPMKIGSVLVPRRLFRFTLPLLAAVPHITRSPERICVSPE